MTTTPRATPWRTRPPRRLVLTAAAVLAVTGATVGALSTAAAAPAPTAAADTYRITGIELRAGGDPANDDADHDPVKKVVLACPAGKVILSGGVTAYEHYDGQVRFTSRLSVTQLEPGQLTDGRYTWSATVEESGIGTNNPWRLVAHATCADRPPGYDLEGESTSVSGAGSKEVAPDCLPGRKMIGGGAAVRSLADTKRVGLTMARVDALGGLLRARAHAAPLGAAEPWGLTATVVCAAENIEGYEIRNAVSSDDPQEWSQSIQSATVTCPSGKYGLTTGGALSTDAGGRATLGGIGSWGRNYGSATGHEPYATSQAWGFVLVRMVCATAELE